MLIQPDTGHHGGAHAHSLSWCVFEMPARRHGGPKGAQGCGSIGLSSSESWLWLWRPPWSLRSRVCGCTAGLTWCSRLAAAAPVENEHWWV